MIGYHEGYGAVPPVKGSPPLPVLVDRMFRAGGWLDAALGLSHRPQQMAMAMATAEAWQSDSALLFEAGTGVGKSLAYLLPGIIHAVHSGRPLIVSTHTIALQEQIEHHDLGLCRQLFERVPDLHGYRDFRYALLLGRGNYLCGTRLKLALEARSELFPSEEQAELERIAAWSQQTRSGLVHELHPAVSGAVWDWVHADAHACNARNCSPQNCFFRRARELLRGANIIIVNHSLLFSLIAAGHYPRGKTRGILLPDDFVVLDEAHTVPQIMTDFFGLRIGEAGLLRELQRLYHVHKGRPRGLLARHGSLPLRAQVLGLSRAAQAFFDGLRTEYLPQGRPFRLRTADWAEHVLDVPMLELIHGMEYLESRMVEGPIQDEFAGARRILDGYRNGIASAIGLADADSVYWLEAAKSGRAVIRSAPLDIAGLARQRLFERCTGLLLTSATLAEGPDMRSFKEKLGATDVRSAQVASPFDYELQMEILIHASAPQLSEDERRPDHRFLCEEILSHARQIDGGTLVLFTSHRDLRAVHELLAGPVADMGRVLLCQGVQGSRSQLLRLMREAGNAVLLGTDSFWTGVDLPGRALSQVILTRLPFENPSHPVAQARAERSVAHGRDPFHEWVLPAALVKFRQGIGRLIRKHSDEGRLVILDSRILQKPYGRLFLDVLPHGRIRRIGGK